jgi:hypothetical protein
MLIIFFFIIVFWILFAQDKVDSKLEDYESNEFPNYTSFSKAKFIEAVCAIGVNLCMIDKKDFGKKNIEIRKYIKKVYPKEIDVREELSNAIKYPKNTESVCWWLKHQTNNFDELEFILFCVHLVSIDGLVSAKEQTEIDRIAEYLGVANYEYQQYIDYVNKSYYSRESNTYTNSRTSINAALIYFGFDKTPSIKELKEKFRQKVKSCHPDLFSTASEAEKKILESKFNELQKYYNEILVEIG